MTIAAALIGLPFSILFIYVFFNRGIFRRTPLTSVENISWVAIHSLVFSGSIGSLFVLLGYQFTVIQGLLLAAATATTSTTIASGVR